MLGYKSVHATMYVCESIDVIHHIRDFGLSIKTITYKWKRMFFVKLQNLNSIDMMVY